MTPKGYAAAVAEVVGASDSLSGQRILLDLCALHPTPIGREELMCTAGISVKRMGGISAYASFHCIVDRINDELHRFGWEIERMSVSQETYALVKWSRQR